MQIDSERIKCERESRAWTQQHLAEVSGLGLRTIQRIESNGSASIESIRSISAAMGVELNELITENRVVEQPTKLTLRVRALIGVLSAALAAVSVALFGAQALADQVMLDIGISLNNNVVEAGSLLTKNGKQAEMRLDESVKLIVLPMVQDDGRVFLSAQVFEFDGRNYILISRPELLTANNKEAEIHVTMDNGDEVVFKITPHAD